MKKLAMLLLIELTLVGCATSNTKTNENDIAPLSSMAPQKNALVARQFVQTMTVRRTEQLSRSSCPASAPEKGTWISMVNYVNACIQAGQWNRVETAGNRMSEEQTDSPWGPYYLGLAAEQRGDLQRALWMLELALKKGSDVGLIHYEKARILFRQEQNVASVDEFTRALKLDGNLVPAHGFLGQIYFRDQEFDKATTHFQMLVQAEPSNALGLAGLAECRIQQTDSRSAKELYSQAIQAYPQQLEFRMRLAYIYEKMDNDIERALQTYKQIQVMLKENRLSGHPDISLSEKIQALEASLRVAQKGRGLASGEGRK